MAATTQEVNRLRRLFRGLDITVDETFDALVQEIYADLESVYPNASRAEWYIRAKLEIGESYLLSAAKTVSYSQNTQSEQLSDRFRALRLILDQWRKELEEETPKTSGPVVDFGSFGPYPPSYREEPRG